MIGWKVVTKGLWSATGRGQPIEYRVGSWVDYPDGCGPLAIFSNREAACNFRMGTRRVFRCEYVPSIHRLLWGSEMFSKVSKAGLPLGTIYADKVKLLEEEFSNG